MHACKDYLRRYKEQEEIAMLKQRDITALRMIRQHLSEPCGRDSYDALFRDMSPVPTIYWCEPGSPPTLPLHTDFDDGLYNSKRRSNRDILKGRFAGGSIFYVTKDDLEVFACLYKKDMTDFSDIQLELLELLEREGPMNIGLMKEITGHLVKDIAPALHKLQEAFIVYEDQVDNEWDRAWYLFENEFPDVNLYRYQKTQALEILLPRFARLCVFFDEEMVKSYYRLPNKLITQTLSGMKEKGLLKEEELSGKTGFILREDEVYLRGTEFPEAMPGVLLLQRNDFMARANADYLKEKYKSTWDALYYLLIDGEFHGAVTGRFKFGPHIIEDIVLDIEESEKVSRREEIINAAGMVFNLEKSPVKRYDGKEI
jgi:hypothetical protein